MAQAIIDVLARTKSAEKSIDSFTASTSKSLKSIESSFASLKTVALGAVAFISAKQLISGISAITEAASVQEDAIKQLNTALSLSGDFSEEASQDLQNFASALQSTSTVGDEVALQQLALAKSFGVSNDQAKQLVQAATDLSAATGISLDSAVRNLGKTFGGLTGELGEVVPALKGLTKEQLEAGEAVGFISSRFGGAAEALTGTFSGAVKQAQNTFGDLLEELGFFITQSPIVINSIKAFSKAIQVAIGFLAKNGPAISQAITGGLIAVVDFIPTVIRGIGTIAKPILSVQALLNKLSGFIRGAIISVLEFALSFEAVQIIVNSVTDSFKTFATVFIEGLARIVSFAAQLPGVGDTFKQFDVDLESIGESISGFGDQVRGSIGADVTEPLKQSLESARQASDAFEDGVDSALVAVAGSFEAGAKAAEGLGDKVRQLAQTKQINIETNLNVKAEGSLFDPLIDSIVSNGPKIASTLTNALSRGSDGASQLLQAGVETAADAFAPGFGKAAGQLFNVLSQGPEKVKELVDGLIQKIPEVINAVVASIPQLLISLIENIDVLLFGLVDAIINGVLLLIEKAPEIIAKLVEEIPQVIDRLILEIPRIIQTLSDQLPEIIPPLIVALQAAAPKIGISLAAQSPRIAIALAKEMPKVALAQAREMPKVAESFALALKDEAKAIVDAIKKGIEDALKGLGGFGGGGGGGGGFLGKAGKSLGLAEGGQIPSGFPNDTFPARLTSGELVIPPGDVKRLSDFLDREQSGERSAGPDVGQILDLLSQSSQKTVTINLMVSEEELANVNLNLDNQGFRTA